MILLLKTCLSLATLKSSSSKRYTVMNISQAICIVIRCIPKAAVCIYQIISYL